MRTTLSVDDHLLAAAKQRARARGQTLGQVVEDALRRELAEPSKAGPAIDIPVFRGGSGPQPGLDLRSSRALAEVLDGANEITKVR
jgi:hypothetical protein